MHLTYKLSQKLTNEAIITACISGDRKAQHHLFVQLSPMLTSVCKRYLKQETEVEDALAESFVLIFTRLQSLKDTDALFGWAKRVAVNQCLQIIRRRTSFNLSLDDIKQEPVIESSSSQSLEHKDLLQLLQYLPDGCRSVFNLFAVEGYSHKEISEMLQISEGTSKSQVNVARIKLQKLVKHHYHIRIEEDELAR